MKLKQLILLIVVAAILVIVYVVQQSGRGGTTKDKSLLLVPVDFNSDSLASVKLECGDKQVTLIQSGEGWTVAESYDYPADTNRLRSLFVKLCDARVAQTVKLTATQLDELSLTPEKAVIMTLIDKSGTELQTFRFGMLHGALSEAGIGGTVGRYMQLADGRNVVVPDRFLEVDAIRRGWLRPDFFQITNPKRVELKRAGKSEWTMIYTDGKPALEGEIPEDKELDDNKTYTLKNAYSWPQFEDIADPKASPEVYGMDKAPELLLLDGDDISYTIRPGAGSDGKYYIRISCAWVGNPQRAVKSEEKPEDRERLDAEYAKEVKAHQDKATKLNQALSAWTYVIEETAYSAFTSSRSNFLKDKPKTDSSKSVAEAGNATSK